MGVLRGEIYESRKLRKEKTGETEQIRKQRCYIDRRKIQTFHDVRLVQKLSIMKNTDAIDCEIGGINFYWRHISYQDFFNAARLSCGVI